MSIWASYFGHPQRTYWLSVKTVNAFGQPTVGASTFQVAELGGSPPPADSEEKHSAPLWCVRRKIPPPHSHEFASYGCTNVCAFFAMRRHEQLSEVAAGSQLTFRSGMHRPSVTKRMSCLQSGGTGASKPSFWSAFFSAAWLTGDVLLLWQISRYRA